MEERGGLLQHGSFCGHVRSLRGQSQGRSYEWRESQRLAPVSRTHSQESRREEEREGDHQLVAALLQHLWRRQKVRDR